eukprot:gene19335-biopygen20064
MTRAQCMQRPAAIDERCLRAARLDLNVSTIGTCERWAECVDPRSCAGLDLRGCRSVRAFNSVSYLRCGGVSACAGAMIPLGACPPAVPCVLRCESERACHALSVSTKGVCVRPAECAYDGACSALDLRGCASVRAPQASPGLRCTGVSACNGSLIPLGGSADCLPSAPCVLTCRGEGACSWLTVSTEGTCTRPANCVGNSVCSHLQLRCAEVRAPAESHGLKCSGRSACAGASIMLGGCPPSSPCELTCGGGAGEGYACSALTVWSDGTCVRPVDCIGKWVCAKLTLRCTEVQAPAPNFNCNGTHACAGAFIPLGDCASQLCGVRCGGDYACRALTVSTSGICVRPAECVGTGVCASLQLQCGQVRAPEMPNLYCHGSEACYHAAIPLGGCRASNACALFCRGDRACDGLTASTNSTCIRPDECIGHSACARLELRCGEVQ